MQPEADAADSEPGTSNAGSVPGPETARQQVETKEVATSPIRFTPTPNSSSPLRARDGEASGEDTQICRVCHSGGESVEWVGCEVCEYWVHLSCVGFEVTKGTNMKRLLQKFNFKCPKHRK